MGALNVSTGTRARLLAGTMLAVTIGTAMPALAQETQGDGTKLEEIVVTAQKREQNLQDVPIAVTALSQAAIQSNRVTNIDDLSGLAPGVQVRAAAGGTQLASFTIRGAVSYGVVPGSDKEVSNYLDGVYLSAPRGSIFELPDVSQIEILRGPQGTLFGRNATAGAVSITTRDPSGRFGITQDITVGNYAQFRSRTSIDLPAVGAFSGYVSYVYDYKRGDIRNANPGVVWDRTAEGFGKQVSVKYLGTKDSDSVFAALKFEPSDSFSTVYKYDHNDDHGSPEGTGLVNFDPAAAGGLIALIQASQPPGAFYVYPDGKRPDVVNNPWVTPLIQHSDGHNLTSKLRVSDDFTLKNVFAYRTSYISANSALTGIDGLELFGTPYAIIGISTTSSSKQWSDELQANYHSQLITVTAGAIWFHSKDATSGPPGSANDSIFMPFPGHVIPLGGAGLALNQATSLAAYTQLELHLTHKLDVVGGVRVTKDKKTGTFTYNSRITDPVFIPTTTVIETPYRKTKPSYLIGLNYKPNDDTLVYGKFSTSFVSGGPGATAAIVYAPETASSFEAGLKADMYDHRLRTNLSVYTVTYKHVQSAQGSQILGPLLGQVGPYLGTFILDQGGIKNHGVELEVSSAPARGLSLGGSLDYSHTTFNNINPLLLATQGGTYGVTLRPQWTAGLSGQYESEPVFGNATLNLRVDANWHSRELSDLNLNDTNPLYASVKYTPATWLVNGRLALQHLDVAGQKGQVAVWVKNMTNDRSATYAENFGFAAGANYQAARTFGVDLRMEIR